MTYHIVTANHKVAKISYQIGISMNSLSVSVTKPSVAVFSSGRYVKKFLKPLESVCIPVHYDVPLSTDSAHLSAGCKAINVFVNDDLSAPVLDILYENDVKIVTLRCAGFDRLDINHAKKLGFSVFRVPAYSPARWQSSP